MFRKVKAITVLTPFEYKTLFRLEKSIVLLRNGNKVIQAALDVGFSSHNTFSTFFKRYYGCPRKKNQIKVALEQKSNDQIFNWHIYQNREGE